MHLAEWFGSHPPLYDIDKTYAENAASGPFFSEKIPERPEVKKQQTFLGIEVNSLIGIPAGPLLTANWTTLAARLGFDILTYKTIRSREHPAHPLPNMLYVRAEGDLEKSPTLVATKTPPLSLDALAVTNSFGMPSKTPEFLLQDIARANATLGPGQLLIVSIVGTKRENCSFLDDFIDAAHLAKEAGAKVVEANFSCPNVDKHEGSLYLSPESVSTFTKALVKALNPIPLVIKVGTFSNNRQLFDTMVALAKSGARAICGINTIKRTVVDEAGQFALGLSRPHSGICGGPIRSAALEFIRAAAEINKKEKLDLAIMGTGGITLPEHFDLFFHAGADVAMSATGMLWDPYLALRYHMEKL